MRDHRPRAERAPLSPRSSRSRSLFHPVAIGLVGLCGLGTGLAACAPARPTAPLPSVLIVTLGSPAESEALDAVAAEGIAWDEAWMHAPSVRPALASVLTGYLPTTHGVRDPVRHAPATPTLAHLLDAEGWHVSMAATGSPAPLHPGEDWGFEVWGEPEDALGTPDPALIWLHGDDGLLDAALDWQDAEPDRHLVVTAVPRVNGPISGDHAGHVPLIWVGPGFPEGLTDGDPVGQIDVAATVLELTGLPTDAVDGVDLRDGGSRWIHQEDARPMLALGRPGMRVERGEGPPVRRIGLDPAPVFDLAPAPATVRIWRVEGALPTDPLGGPRVFAADSDLDVQAVEEVGRMVRSGRLRSALDALDALDARAGPTPATWLLRADLATRQGRPTESLALLEGLFEGNPSAGLALRLAHGHLDMRDPGAAARWFDRLLADWPDHPDGLVGRARCALLLGDLALADATRARLAALHPAWSDRLELSLDLGDGRPVDPAEARRIVAAWPDDPWSELLIARSMWSVGRSVPALEYADAALLRHPRDVGLRLELATWCIELGEHERAVRLLSPLARWFPDDLRVSTLYHAAYAAIVAERVRVESIRAMWRGVPGVQ